eukprot:5100876-Pyramimonas_sp.AAC.1
MAAVGMIENLGAVFIVNRRMHSLLGGQGIAPSMAALRELCEVAHPFDFRNIGQLAHIWYSRTPTTTQSVHEALPEGAGEGSTRTVGQMKSVERPGEELWKHEESPKDLLESFRHAHWEILRKGPREHAASTCNSSRGSMPAATTSTGATLRPRLRDLGKACLESMPSGRRLPGRWKACLGSLQALGASFQGASGDLRRTCWGASRQDIGYRDMLRARATRSGDI